MGEPLDYSKGVNWMVRHDNGDCNADVFFLYTTSVPITEKNDFTPSVYQTIKSTAYICYERGPSCFEGIANIFVPYYRQMSFFGLLKCKTPDGYSKGLYNSIVRTDVYAALDYYFEHYNKGRPFILASHSQGTLLMQHVLSEYMRIHPDYYSRMIAAYTLGFSYSKEYQKNNPHIKFVKGEDDIGVVIAWNVEGVGATRDSFALCEDNVCYINPLNWKTDKTPAGVEMNKGCWDLKTHAVVPGFTGAYIDTKRKSIVAPEAENNGYQFVPTDFFGEKSFHYDEWNFFYENIKENAQKRINAYFKNNRK